MNKHIKNISTKIPHTNRQIDISLNRKNLIITGSNGSGKTSLLASIYHKLVNNYLGSQLLKIPALEKQLHSHEINLENFINSNQESKIIQTKKIIDKFQKRIHFILKDPEIKIYNHSAFIDVLSNNKGLILLFPASRLSQISKPNSVTVSKLKGTSDPHGKKIDQDFGNEIEQHLLNLKTMGSFAITENNDNISSNKIEEWFESLENNLKFLMEDQSLELKFDSSTFNFNILQSNKLPYSFQNLSSGYSAIFKIFSTLLMSSEHLTKTPEELEGVVLIDEIDVHLHVSLQRKIFPFLVKSFPNIQFIITTHSPFVLTSVDNAVIYDLTRREQVEDLSSYSYESVLEGLFSVDSSSNILQKKIEDLALLTDEMEINISELNVTKIKSLINNLKNDIDKLDEESLYYVNKAKLILTKKL